MTRRASALLPVLGLVTLVAVPLAWRLLTPPVAAAAIAPLGPLPLGPALAAQGASGGGLELVLLRAGVSPNALAAGGAAPQSLSGLVDSAEAHFAAHSQELALADAAHASARRETDRLRRLIESGKGSQEDVANFQAQSAALASASAAQEATLSALLDAATAGLTANQRTLLRRIQAAKGWGLPIEFAVVERSQEEWVELRGALANERFASKYGEEADPAAAAFLAHARADQAVASARASLDTNQAAITASWNAAHGD